MKSVCFIVQNPYEIDIRVRRKAEALVAAGYSVDAIALRSPKCGEKEFTLNGVKVHTISLGKMRGSFARYVFEYFAFLVLASWKLLVLTRTRCYAAVDINTLPDFLIFAGWYARRRRAKLILDMHEITPEFFMSKYKVGRSHWLVRLSTWLERISFRYADHVLTINEPIQRLLESRGLDRDKSTIIMNAADDVIFGQDGPPMAKGDAFVMMYHGTLTNIYGLDIAIEALALAQERVPNAELWILGDGPERENLERLGRRLGVDKKVKFVGRVMPQEIPGWLKQSNVGVLATRSDVFLDYSFSNKLSEYIVMDKPVICSRLRTICHYFDDQALAFFEPNQAASLAEQMVRVHGDAALRAAMITHAKQQYASINWAVMKERYLELVNRLCGVRLATTEGSAIGLQTPSLAKAVGHAK